MPMPNKWLLIRASGGDYEPDGLWAIELTPELLTQWRTLQDVYRSAVAKSAELALRKPPSLRYSSGEELWDFLEEDDIEPLVASPSDPTLVDAFDVGLREALRTDLDALHVSDDSIVFTASSKFSSHEYWASVSWSWLREQGVDV